jgi:hypothetical protein
MGVQNLESTIPPIESGPRTSTVKPQSHLTIDLEPYRVSLGWTPIRSEASPSGARILFEYSDTDETYRATLHSLSHPGIRRLLKPFRIERGPQPHQIWSAPSDDLETISKELVRHGQMTFELTNPKSFNVMNDQEWIQIIGDGKLIMTPEFLNHDLNAHLLAAFMDRAVGTALRGRIKLWSGLINAPELKPFEFITSDLAHRLYEINQTFEFETQKLSAAAADFAQHRISKTEFEEKCLSIYKKLLSDPYSSDSAYMSAKDQYTLLKKVKTTLHGMIQNRSTAFSAMDQAYERISRQPEMAVFINASMNPQQLDQAVKRTSQNWFGDPRNN